MEKKKRPAAKPKTPKTVADWQTAVDAAHGALALDAARQYGLVTGGPAVDVARAEQLLADGAKRRIYPGVDAVERFITAMLSKERGT